MPRYGLLVYPSILLAGLCHAQMDTAPTGAVPQMPAAMPAAPGAPQIPAVAASTSGTPGSPIAITLDEAIHRAQGVDSAYGAAKANAGVAGAQVGIARSALLPGVIYHNQYLYTQSSNLLSTIASNGTSLSPVRYIANNAVHEYLSQGVATETIGGAAFAQLGAAKANSAAANAQLEVARRGLVSTVVANFYGVLAAAQKTAIAERALDEAAAFGKNTEEREAAGEVAHADVVRAQLATQQAERTLNDARLAESKARIDLGVFLFPDPTAPYAVAATLDQLPAVPSRAEIEAAARTGNPDLRAAMATLHAANFDLKAARFGYLPDLSVSVYYGIDAPQFALVSPDGTHNLGYSALATLDIPIFDWFATHDRIKQSDYRREQAKADLTLTQRQLLASLDELYREAEIARTQLISLDQSVQTATDSLRLSKLRYTAGEGTVLEVVDAQNSLVTAEAGRVDGAVRYFQALASLQTLTGRMP